MSRIRDILESFEMTEVRDQLGGGDQVSIRGEVLRVEG
jgi:hypothetical protein